MAQKPIRVGQITGIWSFLCSIDWEERWLWGLLLFHLLCALASALAVRYDHTKVQATLFIWYLMLVYWSEYINDWGSRNYRLFSEQQYFDSQGMFISIVFSIPLILNCLFTLVLWMWKSTTLMLKIKKIQVRQQAAEDTKQAEDKSK